MLDLTIAVPVIVALVQAGKTAGLESRFAPILSIVIGVVAFGFLGNADLAQNLFTGLVAGLSASGLYSGAKTVVR